LYYRGSAVGCAELVVLALDLLKYHVDAGVHHHGNGGSQANIGVVGVHQAGLQGLDVLVNDGTQRSDLIRYVVFEEAEAQGGRSGTS